MPLHELIRLTGFARGRSVINRYRQASAAGGRATQ